MSVRAKNHERTGMPIDGGRLCKQLNFANKNARIAKIDFAVTSLAAADCVATIRNFAAFVCRRGGGPPPAVPNRSSSLKQVFPLVGELRARAVCGMYLSHEFTSLHFLFLFFLTTAPHLTTIQQLLSIGSS
jgi:hypothetical protein